MNAGCVYYGNYKISSRSYNSKKMFEIKNLKKFDFINEIDNGCYIKFEGAKHYKFSFVTEKSKNKFTSLIFQSCKKFEVTPQSNIDLLDVHEDFILDLNSNDSKIIFINFNLFFYKLFIFL